MLLSKKLTAEFIGTFWLVFGGVAFAFGLTVLRTKYKP